MMTMIMDHSQSVGPRRVGEENYTILELIIPRIVDVLVWPHQKLALTRIFA